MSFLWGLLKLSPTAHGPMSVPVPVEETAGMTAPCGPADSHPAAGDQPPYQPVASCEDQPPYQPVASCEGQPPYQPVASCEGQQPYQTVASCEGQPPYQPVASCEGQQPYQTVASSEGQRPYQTVASCEGQRPSLPAATSDAGGELDELTALRLQVQALKETEKMLRGQIHLQQKTEAEIRQTANLLRAVAEGTPDAVFIKDLEGRYLLCNQNVARLAGVTVEEMLGKDDGAIFDAEDVRFLQERDRQIMESGKAVTAQEVLTAGGVTRTYLATKAPYRDDQGSVIGIIGISRDITDGKLADELILQSEERFRLLSEATNDAVWDWNLETGTHWWNEGFQVLFGYKNLDFKPTIQAWYELIHPEDREAVVAGFHETVDSGWDKWTAEYRFRREDGSYAHVLDRGYVVRNAVGKSVRMIGSMTDLSVHKQAEEKLLEQATLLDKAQDAIVVRDLEHRVVFWNSSAARLYGWTAAEVTGRSIRDLLYGDPTDFLAATAATVENDEWTGELQQVTKAGCPVTVQGRWTLLRDPQGRPKSILAINTDITERKKLEQQVLRAQRMESLGTLAGGIAHDLNNVLAPIMMSIELLKLDERDAVRLSILSTIEASAQRGADMVKQVLSFARGVEGRQLEVQAAHLLKEIEKIVTETFHKDIRLRSDIAPNLWTVQGDPTQLHQVVLNLCVNARDAMPRGGNLMLSAQNVMLDAQYAAMNLEAKAGPHVVIEVADSGSGMTPVVMERIFEPFYTTKELGKGTGLGLSTTLAIVKSHGGFVHVTSELEKGSRFRSYLPGRIDTHATEKEMAAPETDLPRGRGECILVIDDEAAVRHITQQTLEAFGYQVVQAADGAKALAIYAARQHEIAAVLTDMMMPEMDGPMIIQVMQRMNPQVKIIAASGLNASSMVAKASGAGVKHFIPKPYTAETLLNTMRQVLDR